MSIEVAASEPQPEVYRLNTPGFKLFLKYLEFSLLGYSFFVLIAWLLTRYTSILPAGFFETFYLVLWIGVSLEFAIRVYFANYRLRYIYNEWFSLIIILFPMLQPLRFFGVSRYVILVFSRLLYRRFALIRESRILEVLVVSSIISILAADLFMWFEKDLPGSTMQNFSDALWFSVVSVATVGYGDVVPVSLPGRALAALLIIFGVSVFGLLTASISSHLVARKINKHSHIFGMPLMAVNSDSEQNLEIVIDKLEEIIQRIEKLEQKVDGNLAIGTRNLHQ